MAITQKAAKIYALRWMAENLFNKPDLDSKEFTVYEQEKIFKEMDKLADSIDNRLRRLGDNPAQGLWNDKHVRRQF
jgi:hypothetical protein